MALVLEEFIPYRFNRLSETLSRNASIAYKSEYGMTRPEWRAFALLGQKGTMTATDISFYSTMHKTKVSRAIFALEQKCWVVRKVDVNDRRLEQISLTSQGQRVYRDLVPKMQRVENELIARLGKENSAALFKGLAALEELYLDKETVSRSRKAG